MSSDLAFAIVTFNRPDVVTIEDWGCGWCGFKDRIHEHQEYRGVEDVELAGYQSSADAILLRHVLERRDDWRDVLRNAVKSASKRICVVLSNQTPDRNDLRMNAVVSGLAGFDVRTKKKIRTGRGRLEQIIYARKTKKTR